MMVSISSTSIGVSSEITTEKVQVSPMEETLTGDIFVIHVENDSVFGDGIGCYTVETGNSHTNTSKSILYGGSSGLAATTYLTIHVVETKTDYVTTKYNADYPSISGYSVVFMDSYVTSGPSISGNAIITIWTLPEGLVVNQTLVSEGSTMQDGRFRATTTVTNTNSTHSFTVGIRYLWDYAIDDEDGSVMRTVNPNSTYFTTEQNWTNPTFEYYEESDFTTPNLTVLASVNEPTAIEPKATSPTRLVLADWWDASDYSYNYTTYEKDITEDSCMLYFWDDNVLDNSGGSVSVTAYIATPEFVVTHPPPEEVPEFLPTSLGLIALTISLLVITGILYKHTHKHRRV